MERIWPLMLGLSVLNCTGNVEPASAGCAAPDLAVAIADHASRPGETFHSPEEIDDAAFRAFVQTVSSRVRLSLARQGQCPHRSSDVGPSEIRFVRVPLATSGDAPFPVPPALERRAGEACRITSPWVDVAVDRGPALRLRAIVRFSEPQLLHDQAVLAGMTGAPGGVLMPLSRGEFSRLAQDYANSEILRPPGTAAPQVDERIPAGLLWLFRHAGQSTLDPFEFEAEAAMRRIGQRGQAGYASLVAALIEDCLEGGTSRSIAAIGDARGVFDIGQYALADDGAE